MLSSPDVLPNAMQRQGEKAWAISSRKNWVLSVLGVGLVAFVIAAATSWICPFVPRIHDEFSYLLAADTLLHGRLANPTPEVWQPFQSFHILLEPSYASKYPLGISAVLALGWAVFGTPISGCWISAGICAVSVSWMLAGVTSRRWALIGGLLIGFHPAMQVTWSQSLMSGWLTASGSTLLVGAVFRLRRQFRVDAAGVGGLGIALLALTRPFEGLVATLISAAVLWQLWHGVELKRKLLSAFKFASVAAVPVSIALFFIGMQNLAVTGSIRTMPYQVHEQMYGVAPLFVFGTQHAPSIEGTGNLPTTVRALHYGWSLECFQLRAGLIGWCVGIGQALWVIWSFWFTIVIIPLLTCAYWLRFRLSRLLALAVVVQLLFSAMVCWVFPHYLSPILPWIAALAVLGLRRMFQILVRAGLGSPAKTQKFVFSIVFAECVLLAICAVKSGNDPIRNWAERRAAVASGLKAREGLHLVLVHYSEEHNVHQEWVYNGADLESQKVLWARGERDDWNVRLAEKYGHSRFIWRLDADREDAEPHLVALPRASGKFNFRAIRNDLSF